MTNEKRQLLRHFLATLAYRTQKALRGAPESFGDFQTAPHVRTPHELVWHMTGVLGYARTFFVPVEWQPEKLPTFDAEILRFHDMLESLDHHLDIGTELRRTTPERLLQGPFSDAMTHVGQLAMLRRLYGSPVPSENFVMAAIERTNLGPDQSAPASPDKEWKAPGE